MKTLVAIFILVISSPLWAISGQEGWKAATTKGRVQLLTAYQDFFQELSLQESSNYDEWKIKQTRIFHLLIDSAWADSNMDCIYAGWPSRRVNNLCSSPERNNPSYERGSCSAGQMQCQPMLFGNGLCVPTGSKQQRNLAFSNCNKKFKASGKSVEDVVRGIHANGKEAELFELMEFADRICSSGKQASTPMCSRLKATIDSMRPYVNSRPPEVSPDLRTDNRPAIDVTINGRQADSEQGREVIDAVQTVNRGMSEVARTGTVNPEDCDPATSGEEFDREEPRDYQFEYTTNRAGADPAWRDNFLKDKRETELRPNGFEFQNVGPNTIAGTPLDPSQKVERQWRFVSEDNSRRETYLWVTDDAGSGYLSQLMESVILIVPRKMKQHIEAKGDELHVTLTTGEKVIYDKATKQVKAGVLREGPVDLTPNRFNRKFADVKYQGTGISIRLDKRGEDPRLITGNAVVTQNGRSCQVPARELWRETEFRYPNDRGLVDFLNRKCGNKFNI